MKGAILAAFVLVSLATASLADCYSDYSSCSRQCCERIGGDFSEDDYGTVYCNYGDYESEYYACDDTCVVRELDCLAPGSGCSSQYRYCVSSCGGPGSSDCNGQCAEDAFDCAERNPAPVSTSGCCSAFILLIGGFALALFARRG